MALGQEFSFADLTVFMKGKVVTGCRGIQYSTSQESTLIYGKGKEPIAFSKGKKAYAGSITLLGSEVFALLDSDPNKDIHSIQPFVLTKTLALEDGSGLRTVNIDVLHLQSVDWQWSEADMFKEITIPCLVGKVAYK